MQIRSSLHTLLLAAAALSLGFQCVPANQGDPGALIAFPFDDQLSLAGGEVLVRVMPVEASTADLTVTLDGNDVTSQARVARNDREAGGGGRRADIDHGDPSETGRGDEAGLSRHMERREHIEAGQAAIASTVEPVAGALLATLLLGQGLTGWGWFGLAVVVTGVAGAYRSTGRHPPA